MARLQWIGDKDWRNTRQKDEQLTEGLKNECIWIFGGKQCYPFSMAILGAGKRPSVRMVICNRLCHWWATESLAGVDG